MFKIKSKIIIASILISAVSHPTHCKNIVSKTIEKIYCTLFGQEDLSPQYRIKMNKALVRHRIENPDQVLVKKMNGFASKLLNLNLYSFTLDGIWLNENLLEKCTPEERTFMMHHEAAHYKNNHHNKLLAKIVPVAVTLPALTILFRNKIVPFKNRVAKYAVLSGLCILELLGITELIARPTLKQQEREADVSAAKALCANGKIDAVQGYVQELENLIDNGYGNDYEPWHPTVAEQHAYLRPILTFYEKY